MNYGEADRIVTLFGRDTGRVSALARGARKSQRRFAGGLSLCALGSAALRERPGADLATLERFDATESHAALGTDVARMAHAAYAAELVGKLCAPRQVEAGGVRLAGRRSCGCSTATAPARSGCACSRSGCCRALGFGPVLDTCAACGGRSASPGRAASEVAFRWDPDRGGAVCVALRARRPADASRRCARR